MDGMEGGRDQGGIGGRGTERTTDSSNQLRDAITSSVQSDSSLAACFLVDEDNGHTA